MLAWEVEFCFCFFKPAKDEQWFYCPVFACELIAPLWSQSRMWGEQPQGSLRNRAANCAEAEEGHGQVKV